MQGEIFWNMNHNDLITIATKQHQNRAHRQQHNSKWIFVCLSKIFAKNKDKSFYPNLIKSWASA